MSKRESLGRGLEALIPRIDRNPESPRSPSEIPIEKIRRNPRQPRKQFDGDSIDRLADSIRERGILQPLLVTADGDGYLLVAGERRWRAAQ